MYSTYSKSETLIVPTLVRIHEYRAYWHWSTWDAWFLQLGNRCLWEDGNIFPWAQERLLIWCQRKISLPLAKNFQPDLGCANNDLIKAVNQWEKQQNLNLACGFAVFYELQKNPHAVPLFGVPFWISEKQTNVACTVHLHRLHRERASLSLHCSLLDFQWKIGEKYVPN